MALHFGRGGGEEGGGWKGFSDGGCGGERGASRGAQKYILLGGTKLMKRNFDMNFDQMHFMD